jgi:hypothetical protein
VQIPQDFFIVHRLRLQHIPYVIKLAQILYAELTASARADVHEWSADRRAIKERAPVEEPEHYYQLLTLKEKRPSSL